MNFSFGQQKKDEEVKQEVDSAWRISRASA